MKVTRHQLLSPAVLAYLFLGGGLPRLSIGLANAIMESWSIDEETIDRLHLAAIPTKIQNFMIAEAAAQKFGDLSRVEGFYKCRGLWWIDIDHDLAERGFLMPVTHTRYGWIDRMVAFRSPKDKQGFPVKVRRETRAAA